MMPTHNHHWTDNCPSPVFHTRIWAGGAGGNINVILANAVAHLRVLAVPADRVEKLKDDVHGAPSYPAALAAIERWFAIDGIAKGRSS